MARETSAQWADAVERAAPPTANYDPTVQRTTDTLWIILVTGLVGLLAVTVAQTDKVVTKIASGPAARLGLFITSPRQSGGQ
jgi:hypothetical protein